MRDGFGRYVNLYIAATMHSSQLCAVTSNGGRRSPMAPSVHGRRDLRIVSEATCLGSPSSGKRHESTRTTHRYVKADLAKNENALTQFEALDARLRFGSPDSLVRFLHTR